MATGTVVTNNGRIVAMNRFMKVVPDYTAPTEFRVGIGTTTPIITDTDLAAKIPFTGTETVDDCEATTGWVAGADSVVSLNTTSYKIGSASLNIYKTGAGAAVGSASKTTTSLNFTSKELSIWYYIKDAAALAKLATLACFTIRFGSDSSNYYYWDKDKSFFAVGWNLVTNLTSANATGTTGTPVIAACDYTEILITATGAAIVWAAGDMAIDDIKLISADDYNFAIDTGQPLLNETSITGSTQCTITTVDANGYSITEFGLINTDATPKLLSHAVFTAVTKNINTQLIITEVDKMQ